MRTIIPGLLLIAILLSGCTGTIDTPASDSPKEIAESFFNASCNNDMDTVLSLLTEDIVFRQEPPGVRIEGKDELEAMMKNDMVWNHERSLIGTFNVMGDIVEYFAEVTGDDFRIAGLDSMNASYELWMRNGKIYSILVRPDAGDWTKMIESTSGGIGITVEFVKQGIKVTGLAENSPARDAGIKQGDIITAVDGIDYSRMREGEIILRIKGKPGSKVLLTVLPQGVNDLVDIEVVRSKLD